MEYSPIKLSSKSIEEVVAICDKHGNSALELIGILHETQSHFGYLPVEVQAIIAKQLNIAPSRVYGVVTFYSFFTMTPKGKYPISVCLGTACYVKGAEKVLDELKKVLKVDVGGTTPDGVFSLSSLRCVGACGLAPVVLVGDRVYGRVTIADVERIVKETDPTYQL